MIILLHRRASFVLLPIRWHLIRVALRWCSPFNRRLRRLRLVVNAWNDAKQKETWFIVDRFHSSNNNDDQRHHQEGFVVVREQWQLTGTANEINIMKHVSRGLEASSFAPFSYVNTFFGRKGAHKWAPYYLCMQLGGDSYLFIWTYKCA